MAPFDSLLGQAPQGRGQTFFDETVTDMRVSFEFFPPKNAAMEETLWSAIQDLEGLNPSFVSVTYGAGGTTRDRTLGTVKRIIEETGLAPAAHLTCVGATKEEVNSVIKEFWDVGVRRIVALRGDPQGGASQYEPHPGGYANAAELVEGIRKIADFDIAVGAYPEKHPDSPTLEADLENLKRKVDAGATRAITQFFFDADSYFRFVENCHAYDINVPIIPGILPITNFKSLNNFATACGTSVPKWLCDTFEGLDDKPQTRNLVAASVASDLCKKLYAGGVRDFHFYTLNRSELSYAICRTLGVRPQAVKEEGQGNV